MKTLVTMKYLLLIPLLGLTLSHSVWAYQHGMAMGDRDHAPMMQRGMGMMGGCPMMSRNMHEMDPDGDMTGPMSIMGMGGMRGGMMAEMGMMGPGPMMGMGMQLSREQQAQMRRIQRDLRRQHWDTLGKLMEAREEMRERLAAENPDPKAVGETHARIAELKRPLIEARIKAMNDMRALLTEEQRERLRSGPQGMGERRPGGMMGH